MPRALVPGSPLGDSTWFHPNIIHFTLATRIYLPIRSISNSSNEAMCEQTGQNSEPGPGSKIHRNNDLVPFLCDLVFIRYTVDKCFNVDQEKHGLPGVSYCCKNTAITDP